LRTSSTGRATDHDPRLIPPSPNAPGSPTEDIMNAQQIRFVGADATGGTRRSPNLHGPHDHGPKRRRVSALLAALGCAPRPWCSAPLRLSPAPTPPWFPPRSRARSRRGCIRCCGTSSPRAFPASWSESRTGARPGLSLQGSPTWPPARRCARTPGSGWAASPRPSWPPWSSNSWGRDASPWTSRWDADCRAC
jgi:hypothetical protein